MRMGTNRIYGDISQSIMFTHPIPYTILIPRPVSGQENVFGHVWLPEVLVSYICRERLRFSPSAVLYRTQSGSSLGYEMLHLVPTGYIKESLYKKLPSMFYTIDPQRRRVISSLRTGKGFPWVSVCQIRREPPRLLPPLKWWACTVPCYIEHNVVVA